MRYEVSLAEISRQDVVGSYLFNSQLLTSDHQDAITMLCPQQVQETESARRALQGILDSGGPIIDCEFVELRESMNNGGGPACLRLRVPMTENQWESLPGSIRWSESIADQLCEVIERLYPESITLDELVTTELCQQAARAVTAVEGVLGLHHP